MNGPTLLFSCALLVAAVSSGTLSAQAGVTLSGRLLNALEKKQRHGSNRIDRFVRLERIDPKIGQELRRMRQQEEIHQREIQAMMMRSDPQAELNSVA